MLCSAVLTSPLGTRFAGADDAPESPLTIHGRLFAQAGYVSDESEPIDGTASAPHQAVDLALASARLGVDYQAMSWLALTLELELAGKPRANDVYAEAESRHFVARFGQFKMPISIIEMESAWTLPMANRGVLHDLLLNRLAVAGRRPGAIAQVRGGGKLDPAVTIGAFQASNPEMGGAYLKGESTDSQNTAIRISVTPGPVRLAGFVERRTAKILGAIAHFWLFGGDMKLDLPFATHGLRVWAEGMAGSSWYGPDFDRRYDATFATARAIVAWRHGGLSAGQVYVEPFVTLGALDADTGNPDDVVTEGFVGVNVGYWRRARLTLQVELAQRPSGILSQLFAGDTTITDHKAVVLQAGAAF